MSDCAIFYARVLGGKPKFPDPARVSRLLAVLEGQEIDVLIRKHRKARTLPQNAYFHGVVLPLLAETAGYDLDEMKDALKIKFLQTHAESGLPTVRGTSDLSTAEFNNFIENCVRLGAEMFGIVIPDPE